MPSLAHLPVSALGTAASRIEEIVRSTSNDLVIHSAQFINMEAKARKFSGGYLKMEGSTYTIAVMAADKKRDSSLIGLYANVKAERYSPTLESQMAAQRIYNVLKIHGTASVMANLSLGDETLVVRKILTNLSSDLYKSDIATLNFTNLIESLKRAQNDFETIYACRVDQNISEADIILVAAQRRALEAAICGFMKYLDAMATVDDDSLWHDLHSKIEERLTKMARGSRPENRILTEAKP